MATLLVVFIALGALGVAYIVYGRYLASRVVSLDANAITPSHAFADGKDFVPTPLNIVFGHHFTSIAGTGPIVGPAIAVFWGWLPAMLWVVLGAILIGGVHDFFSLVISLRNQGRSIGEIAGRLISPRAKVLFLIVLSLALWIVLAIFGMVIATIFAVYPESVLPVWIAMPIAVVLGLRHRSGKNIRLDAIIGLVVIYVAIWLGVYVCPVDLSGVLPSADAPGLAAYLNPIVVWTCILMIYCFFASVLPVWLLLQPRDFVNSLQLNVAMGGVLIGLVVACLSGSASLFTSTEAVSRNVPADAPPIFPFLFITIACGACSGFHCLVSSGTSSKQVDRETDAKAVGYGAMLLESGLAVVVILACTAGVGMGALDHVSGRTGQLERLSDSEGVEVSGADAWGLYYGRMKMISVDSPEVSVGNASPLADLQGATGTRRLEPAESSWKAMKLKQCLAAFVDGGANFLSAIGLPLPFGVGIVAVLVASFAATTLDTATRLHRYVIQEFGSTTGLRPLTGKYTATSLAVGVGFLIAVFAGAAPGTGGFLLWPLFGATNQLLAGLALMVATFYLWRRSKPIAIVALPMLIMMIMPATAMTWDLTQNWWPGSADGNPLLFAFGLLILGLQAWMVIEGILIFRKSRGVLEPQIEAPTLAEG
jgi:carbon starvation protein